MTFNEAMQEVCTKCGTSAQTHRLTPTGNFYCLQLNEAGRDRYMPGYYGRKTSGVVDLTRIVYQCAVRYLNHASLSGAVAKEIQRGIKSPVGDPA